MDDLGPVNDGITIEQRSIDDQVSRLQARIYSLKTERNTYARISRLPAEIMSEIFIVAKWFSIDARILSKLLRGPDYSGERNWLNVAGVCTHWRELTLNSPRLWSTIDLTPLDRALAMIKRSKSVPLSISCPNIMEEGQDMDQVAQLVMSNIHRIRELDIGARKDERLFKFLRLNEGESAPMLQSLTIRGPMFSLPADILKRSMSSLQELSIFKGTLTSPFPPLPHLKRLAIEPMVEMITSNLSLEVLLGTLQNTPELEELRVREVIASNDEAAMDQILPVASLPHLTHLDISGLTVSSSKLFQCINYPKTTSVSFDCQTFTTGSDLSHLLNALNHLTSDPDQIIQDVTITTLNNFEILLESLDMSQFFNLTLKGAAFDSATAAIAILAAVPFSKTTFLHLDCISRGTIQPSLFAKCGEVYDLTLTACPVEVFRGLSELEGSQLPLPNLRKLYVNQCIFNYSSVERDSAMCKAMMAFLKQRKRMKARIQQLTINECDISGSVVEEFEKFVSVEWDNYEVQDDEQQEEDYDESEED